MADLRSSATSPLRTKIAPLITRSEQSIVDARQALAEATRTKEEAAKAEQQGDAETLEAATTRTILLQKESVASVLVARESLTAATRIVDEADQKGTADPAEIDAARDDTARAGEAVSAVEDEVNETVPDEVIEEAEEELASSTGDGASVDDAEPALEPETTPPPDDVALPDDDVVGDATPPAESAVKPEPEPAPTKVPKQAPPEPELVSAELDVDAWAKVGPGWLHIESGVVYSEPGGWVLDDEPGVLELDGSTLAEQFQLLTDHGAASDPRLFFNGLTYEVPATHYDPATKAFLDSDGKVVGYHVSIADQIGPVLPELNVRYDAANDRWLQPDGDVIPPDAAPFTGPVVPLAGLDEEEIMALLAATDHPAVAEVRAAGPNGHLWAGVPADPTLTALLADHGDGLIDQLYLDVSTGTLHLSPDANDATELDVDEWARTDEGWLNIETGALHAAPFGQVVDDSPGLIPLANTTLYEQYTGLSFDGATLEASGGGPEGYNVPATHYDPATKAFLDGNGNVVGYHETVADQISPPILEGHRYDAVNRRWIDPQGQPVPRHEGPFDGPVIPLDGLNEQQILSLLASLDHPAVAQISSFSDSGVRVFNGAVKDPTLAALLPQSGDGSIHQLYVDVRTGTLHLSPDATDDTVFDVDGWARVDGAWLHVESGVLYEAIGGDVLDDAPGVIELDGTTLYEQFMGLTPSGADWDADRFNTTGAYNIPATHYDPATKAFLDPDGNVVGYHESVADQIGPLVGDRRYDPVNDRWISANGDPLPPSDAFPASGIIPLAGYGEQQLLAMLAAAGHPAMIVGPVTGDGPVNTFTGATQDPTLAALLDGIDEGSLDGVYLDVTTGSLLSYDPTKETHIRVVDKQGAEHVIILERETGHAFFADGAPATGQHLLSFGLDHDTLVELGAIDAPTGKTKAPPPDDVTSDEAAASEPATADDTDVLIGDEALDTPVDPPADAGIDDDGTGDDVSEGPGDATEVELDDGDSVPATEESSIDDLFADDPLADSTVDADGTFGDDGTFSDDGTDDFAAVDDTVTDEPADDAVDTLDSIE